MTWVTPRVWVAGERVTASKMNEISTDFNALFPHTAGGDLAYRDPAGAYLTALVIAAAGRVMYSDGTKPVWSTAPSAGAIQTSNGSIPTFLALGAAYKFLQGGASPSYGAIIKNRQGGSATNWSTAGTTDYTEDGTQVQSGAASISISGGNGTVGIGFPVAFTETPSVKLTVLLNATKRVGVYVTSVSTTTLNLRAYDVDAETYNIVVMWEATAGV